MRSTVGVAPPVGCALAIPKTNARSAGNECPAAYQNGLGNAQTAGLPN
jgi:hypothetical protein